MIVLSANNLTKVYGTDVILERASFHLNGGDKVGIVGRNGAGKTTLLRMLTGELTPDEGEFFVAQNLKVGFLAQRDNFNPDGTVIGEINGIFHGLAALEEEIVRLSDEAAAHPEDTRLMDRLFASQEKFEREGGYTYKSEIVGILSSMAFDESFYNKKIRELSGGERTRLALAALLLEKPDILLLDEPTNHLDIGTLGWLEQYVASYKGTVMIVSHDRYFLDKTVNRIFEVENHHLYTYTGKYSDYAAQKRARRESELRAYEKQEREIRRQEDMIRSMKQHGTEHLAKRAASREKRLAMVERVERPEALEGSMRIEFKEDFPSGMDVIMAEGLAKGFDERRSGSWKSCETTATESVNACGTYDGAESNQWSRSVGRRELFANVDLDIKRGERICIVGPNGVGKTTLLRILLGEIKPDSGHLKIGHNVAFGYYDQGQLLLNGANTVLEEMKDAYRLYSDTQMRSILGRFLFRGEDVFLNVGSLSGGEKARLSLLKLMLSGANTLVLDEPTNHLDIESKEVFEEALMEFPGTVIVVSHDRYFLQRIPTRILELGAGGVTEYLGKYDYYVEKKAREAGSGKKYLTEMRSGEQVTPQPASSASTPLGEPSDRGTVAPDQHSLASPKGEVPSEARRRGNPEVSLGSAEQRRLNKEKEAEERRRTRRIEKLEEEITELEEKIAELESELSKPENAADYELLARIAGEREELAAKLEAAYTEWEELQ